MGKEGGVAGKPKHLVSMGVSMGGSMGGNGGLVIPGGFGPQPRAPGTRSRK